MTAIPPTPSPARAPLWRRLSPEHASALALAAVCGLFFAPAFDPGSQFLFRDAGRMHWPMKAWFAQELSRGHLPEWNPFAGVGVPVIATGVDAVLHPLNLLLVVLPLGAAFKAWVMLSALAAGLGAAAWARRLGAAGPTATLAGFAFMLTGFVASSTDNLTYLTAIAAAPWLLAAAHAFGSEGGPRRLAAAGLVSFLCAAAGDPMGWGAAVLLAALQTYGAGATGRTRIRRALVLLLACAAAAAPVVLPVVMWMPSSSRAGPLVEREFRCWNLAPARLLELFVPYVSRGPIGEVYDEVYEAIAPDDPTMRPWVLSVYSGASVIALALVSASRDRRGRFLLGGAAVAAWMAMGHHAGFGAIARALPVVGKLRYWEKLAAWPALFLGVAAALGAAAVLSHARTARRLATGSAAAAAALLAVAATAWLAPDAVGHAIGAGARGPGVRAKIAANLVEGALHATVALLALAAVSWALARGRLGRAGPAIVAAVVALDLAVANESSYVLSPASIVTDRSPLVAVAQGEGPFPRVVTPFDPPHDRFPALTGFESKWRVGSRILADAWNVPAGVGNFDAYTGMTAGRLLQVRQTLGPLGLPKRAGLWGFSLVATPANARAVAQLELPPPLDVAGVDEDASAWLVRVPHRPRTYVAPEMASATAEGAFEFARTEPPESGRSVVEGAVPPVHAGEGTASVVSDDGERVVVEAAVPGEAPALLVLSDQYAPGWTAEVDGLPAPIVPTNYLVRGVWISGGRHVVTFRYGTPGLLAGLGIALGCATVVLVWALLARAAQRRR